jgi:tRNA nucleotidyltransferase (CCA-adding enzyme)
VLDKLYNSLVPELRQLLLEIAQIAETQNWQLYLVGGAVRDLLLASAANTMQPNQKLLLPDLDLVVDGLYPAATIGAGVELARSLQSRYPQARLEIHSKFQTAALLWQDDPIFQTLAIDLATARTEIYPYPAANPKVKASSIQQDLYRRDFTINAMALRLTNPHAGELLDLFGGEQDLSARQIRVLHANSFVEDPTRIFRAVRFAVRLGFQLEPQTEGYIHAAIASGIYEQVRSQYPVVPALQTRLRAELKYIFQSPHYYVMVRQLANLGALRCIHPQLEPNQNLWRQLRLASRLRQKKRATESLPSTLSKVFQVPHWLVLLEILIAQLPTDLPAVVAKELQLPQDSIERLTSLAEVNQQVATQLPNCQRPSQMVEVLKHYDPTLLALLTILSDRPIRHWLWLYLTCWAQTKPLLDGNDLRELGYKPGSQFREILQLLQTATIDGVITNSTEAKAFLAKGEIGSREGIGGSSDQ